MKRLTKAQLMARQEALYECAGHLELDWTDDPIEREQGDKVADWLRKRARKILTEAQEIHED